MLNVQSNEFTDNDHSHPAAVGLFCLKNRFLRIRDFPDESNCSRKPAINTRSNVVRAIEPRDRRKLLVCRPVQNSAFQKPFKFLARSAHGVFNRIGRERQFTGNLHSILRNERVAHWRITSFYSVEVRSWQGLVQISLTLAPLKRICS
jgi:hypothetical protein